MEVRSALFFEVLSMWWVGKGLCFVRLRMMMKLLFCPMMMIMSERSKKQAIVTDSNVIEKSPAIAKLYYAKEIPLPSLREICDLCMEPQKPGEPILCGRAVTHVNADKLVYLRDLVELALKLYNDDKLKSFKLVKVCKINRVGAGYYGLTFRAQEDGSEECPVFEVLSMWWVGKGLCFVRSRMMVKLHFCPMMTITLVQQNEHVKMKIVPLEYRIYLQKMTLCYSFFDEVKHYVTVSKFIFS